jgi:hypothetical protein
LNSQVESGLEKFGTLDFGAKVKSVISKVGSLTFFSQVKSPASSKNFCFHHILTPQISLISRFFLTIFREVGIFTKFSNFPKAVC